MRFPSCLVISLLLLGSSACKNAPPEPESHPPPAAPSASALPPAADTPKAETATPAASAAPSASAASAIPAPPDVAAPPTDAKKTASGLATKVLKKGTGKDHPVDTDRVKVHYTGWTKDGKMFDSSVPRGEPTTFGVSEVIKGWTEALKLMVTGEKRRVWIPAELAYGKQPQMGAPSGDLTFDVELIDILKPPTVPDDLKSPPASAKKTASGLKYRLLTTGKGKDHPTATSRVTVNYSGWTLDGKMFDSSVARGTPATFSLNQVIKGWTEGVQLMVVGDKARFWIPADLAYGDTAKRPGAPSGPLVFDIELLNIQ
ncbi:MAG TPA: FKBP-type peptidyl-prolyl cis-trans isomerase [Polyangiaceae bacterium]|jgi:peptidylprolyl isomerase